MQHVTNVHVHVISKGLFLGRGYTSPQSAPVVGSKTPPFLSPTPFVAFVYLTPSVVHPQF